MDGEERLVSRRAFYFPHGLWYADKISIGNCKWDNSQTSIWWPGSVAEWELLFMRAIRILSLPCISFIKTIRSSFLCACKLKNWTEPLHCLRCYRKCPVRKLTPKSYFYNSIKTQSQYRLMTKWWNKLREYLHFEK